MKLLNIIILLALISLTACKTDSKGTDSDGQTVTTDSVEQPQIKIEVDKSDQQENIPTGIVFDPDRFPYLEPLNDSTTLMHAFTVKMQLTHSYPLAPVTNDRLTWINADNSTETMGTFLSYVVKGRKIMLAAVNYRVDYFKKTVKGYSSVDSSFYSARSYFLLDAEKSKVIRERQKIQTASGQHAYVEEYYSVRSEQFTPKYVALGYLEYNEDYIVGFVMNAVDEFEFKDALPPFYKLIRSFKAE